MARSTGTSWRSFSERSLGPAADPPIGGAPEEMRHVTARDRHARTLRSTTDTGVDDHRNNGSSLPLADGQPRVNGFGSTGDPESVSALIGPRAAASANGPLGADPRDVDFGRVTINVPQGLLGACPSWKRAMDVVVAAIGLVMLSPLLLVIAAWVKCVSRGPIIFRQQRFGLAGRPFTLWKFRTIETATLHAADVRGVACGVSERHRSHVSDLMASDRPLEKCDRELPVVCGGRLLRQLGLDELPQLVNVLRGEMSLVGPRPDVVPLDKYPTWQRRRFDVLPGITGLWQVSGKNTTTFSTMMRMDISYVERCSLWLDVQILFRTIPAILRD